MSRIRVLSAVIHLSLIGAGICIVPKTKFEVNYPKELNISGVKIYAFRRDSNGEIEDLETTSGGDIINAKNGHLTFQDKNATVEIGLGYRADDGVVKIEVDSNYTVLVSTSATPTGSCERSITTKNGSPVQCSGELIFEETFDGTSIDENRWKQERRFSTNPDYEFVAYLNNDDVLHLENGLLNIKPIATTKIYGAGLRNRELDFGITCTGELGTEECHHGADAYDILHPLISGQISTKEKFSFKYGKVQIRAKLPNAEWVVPQIFLNPKEAIYGKMDYNSGQMRVAYTLGTKTCDLRGGVLLNSAEPFRSLKVCNMLCPENNNWSNDFHEYTLEWRADQITVAVDGIVYCDIKPGAGYNELRVDGKSLPNANVLGFSTPLAPFDREFYITLGYSVGGHNDFVDSDSVWPRGKPWYNSDPKAMTKFWKTFKGNSDWLSDRGIFQVDYIRVYAI